MQLDQYRIAVRERGYLDILDLALRVAATRALPLLAAAALGIAPFFLLNLWLLRPLAAPGVDDAPPIGYAMLMIGLIVWELPLATAPMTLVLGQSLFQEKVSARRAAADFLASLPQLIVFQVLLRGLLVPLVVTWFVLFSSWAHLNEVLLLERNPMRSNRGGMTTYRRAGVLHTGFVGDLFGRWMAAAAFGALLSVAIWYSLCLADYIMAGGKWLDQAAWLVYYPLAIWASLAFFAIVRFLAYLDLRIRREGWEVELLMRAEGHRLRRRLQ